MRPTALAVLLISSLTLVPAAADGPGATFGNPVLPGGYPDPSICHADGAWYLVNSSFEYFPGLPIHRSTDLVNWEPVGHALHRESQVSGPVNLVDVQSDGGIHAPSIRCRDGRFLVVTTNVYTPPEPGGPTGFVNFVVTADDPAGPWSEPVVIEGAPGIDPDIFFDDDGRAWYVGNRAPADPAFEGEGEIWLQEIDPENWQLRGERHALWRGACGGTWAEGPHLYKRDGRYYLLIAEGGTSFNHAVTIAVADEITGPYESNPRNPILTSRHLGYDHWVNSTGHADLFELPDGRWYAVFLGIRNETARRSNMGRETFLAPVRWEREPFEWKAVRHEWPVISPDSGRVEPRYPTPFADTVQRPPAALHDDFDAPRLGLAWNFRRLPQPDGHSLTARPGFLRLYARAPFGPRARAGFAGVRQTASAFRLATAMRFDPGQDGSQAGLALVQKDDHYLAFTLHRENGTMRLRATGRSGADEERFADRALEKYDGELVLSVVADGNGYRLEYSAPGAQSVQELARLPADLLLSRGYTGAYVGPYAAHENAAGVDYADFDWLRFEALAE